ncbi:hypothetical protein VCHA52P454_40433 [Vibrio chagasii]|nr:hypothetical protein VCHA34P120_20351 [Vibrio chagasii]CAH7325182.1 hypothetical protein VCHA52P454_40433 [Vibrio chagasii]
MFESKALQAKSQISKFTIILNNKIMMAKDKHKIEFNFM